MYGPPLYSANDISAGADAALLEQLADPDANVLVNADLVYRPYEENAVLYHQYAALLGPAFLTEQDVLVARLGQYNWFNRNQDFKRLRLALQDDDMLITQHRIPREEHHTYEVNRNTLPRKPILAGPLIHSSLHGLYHTPSELKVSSEVVDTASSKWYDGVRDAECHYADLYEQGRGTVVVGRSADLDGEYAFMQLGMKSSAMKTAGV